MSQNNACVLTAYLRPNSGAVERLMALRPQLERDFAEHLPGFVSATLVVLDGGEEWRDIVVLKEGSPVDTPIDTESYKEWSTLVELTGHDMCTQISRFEP